METEVREYTIEKVSNYITFRVPEGAEVLHFGTRFDSHGDGSLCVWFRVNPLAPRVDRRLRLTFTEHPLTPDVGRHVGTCQLFSLVWHLFEVES